MNLSGILRHRLLGRLLRVPLRLLPPNATMRVLQGPLRGARWIAGASTHGCWLGSYEHDKHRRFAATLQPGQVVYDVGANAGFYTLLAARRVGGQGNVVAFEPLPRNLHYLCRHLALNRERAVRVVDAAVADRDGTAMLDPGPHPSMASLDVGGSVQVRTVRLDTLVAEGLPPPDVIKIDVEGAECQVLRGAQEVLVTHRPVVFLATHGPQVHAACCELLRELGYGLVPLDTSEAETATEVVACWAPRTG